MIIKKLIINIILVISLFSCSMQEDIKVNNGTSLHRETIIKEDSKLIYTYSEGVLSYGDSIFITIDLNFPASLSPILRLNSAGNESIMKNGIVLDIQQTPPLFQNDGSIGMIIKIVFEAYLPGTVIMNPFTIDMVSAGRKSKPQFSFVVNSINFEFAGDPSLISMDSGNTDNSEERELADLIIIHDESEYLKLIFIISAFVIFIVIILLIFFLRRKPAKKEIDKEAVLLELKEQFKKEYLGHSEQKDLRQAYGKLKKIIQLTSNSTDSPDKKEEYILECNKIFFPGKKITGEKAVKKLIDMFNDLSTGNNK